jgi:DivIVA domain-containing protein
MSDSGFHLTPVDIRAQEFTRALFGYERAGVEDFRTRVAEELERLIRERATMEERLNSFREQLKAYRDREKAINDALVLAQQLRAETEQAAARSAELAVSEARARADAVVGEARSREEEVRRDIEQAHRQFSAYIASFRLLLERQLSELDALEAHERDGSPPRPDQ